MSSKYVTDDDDCVPFGEEVDRGANVEFLVASIDVVPANNAVVDAGTTVKEIIEVNDERVSAAVVAATAAVVLFVKFRASTTTLKHDERKTARRGRRKKQSEEDEQEIMIFFFFFKPINKFKEKYKSKTREK